MRATVASPVPSCFADVPSGAIESVWEWGTEKWLSGLPIPAAVCVLSDGVGRIIARNEAFTREIATLYDTDAQMLSTLATFMADAVDVGGMIKHTISRSQNVRKTIYEMTLAPQHMPIVAGDVFLASFIDKSGEAATLANLRREILCDSLTGLCSRIGFEESIEERVGMWNDISESAPNSGAYALIAIDLARFSQVNQGAGTIIGDELLISFAARLRSVIRRRDILARLGGNEFGVFVALNNVKTDLNEVIERIRSRLAQPFRLSELEIIVDAAIGIAIGKTKRDDPLQILRNAQIALKQAKPDAQVKLFKPVTLDRVRRRFSLETELHKALEEDKLYLQFQPVVNLRTLEVTAFEALARWTDPVRGEISPNEFIPLAEDCGLIVPLGRWALRKAMSTLADWDRRAGKCVTPRMNINISAVQFRRDNIAEAVADAMRSSGIEGNRLTLELTESVIVHDPEIAARSMEQLKALKANLAMDDFGTGYSNLAGLKRLPIDILKIDRSFVTDMLLDEDKIAVVHTILTLAQSLDMSVVAEGIETQQMMLQLSRMGCRFGQGYYFAKPLSEESAFEFIRKPPSWDIV